MRPLTPPYEGPTPPQNSGPGSRLGRTDCSVSGFSIQTRPVDRTAICDRTDRPRKIPQTHHPGRFSAYIWQSHGVFGVWFSHAKVEMIKTKSTTRIFTSYVHACTEKTPKACPCAHRPTHPKGRPGRDPSKVLSSNMSTSSKSTLSKPRHDPWDCQDGLPRNGQGWCVWGVWLGRQSVLAVPDRS